MNILFICLGNICRSVTAEEIFRQKAQQTGLQHLHIDSAGIINYHEGELADSRMRHHAQEHGYHLTHRSRPITTNDFHHFDMIVAMDDNNIKALQRLAPNGTQNKIVRMVDFLEHHEAKEIPDPYYGGAKDFEWVIELLEDACEGLLGKLSQ